MADIYENENILEVLRLLGSGKSVLGTAQLEEYESFIPRILLEFIPQPEEGSPRGIVVCKDDDTAKKIHDRASKELKPNDLTIDLIIEKGNKLKQRNDLFDGTEIIIGTPKRLCELYFQNGFNIGKLKLFLILEIDDQMRLGFRGFISRIAESLPKCRQLVFTRNAEEDRTVAYLNQFVNLVSVVYFKQLDD
ncbi:MAG: DEAD/DEAH box helicase [Bacteroidetes bacterium]|nr:DEAD/DEAH box helicase [Bacteroidota bacterium]